MGVSHTAIKQKSLFVNAIKTIGETGLEFNDQLIDEQIEFLLKQKEINKQKMSAKLVKTITTIGEQSKKLEESEKRMNQKRTDGKGLF